GPIFLVPADEDNVPTLTRPRTALDNKPGILPQSRSCHQPEQDRRQRQSRTLDSSHCARSSYEWCVKFGSYTIVCERSKVRLGRVGKACGCHGGKDRSFQRRELPDTLPVRWFVNAGEAVSIDVPGRNRTTALDDRRRGELAPGLHPDRARSAFRSSSGR